MFKKVLSSFLFTFVFLTSFVCAQNLDPQPYKFSWKATEGAGGYLAEVQDLSGNAVASQQVSSAVTSITLKLVPGSYQLKMTTLNRLLKAEASTDWLPIHVAAAGPPKVGSVSPILVVPGTEASLDVPVSGLAQDATAALTTPTGATIALPVGQPSGGVLTLNLPTLTERGDYSIAITNPPKLTTTVAGKLSVHYSVPVVDNIDPPSLTQSAMAQALHITGRNFSGEAVVVLQGQDGKQASLVINQRSDTSLTAIVPPNLGANAYQVMVANAADELPVSSGSIAVRAVAQGPKIGALVVEKGQLAITASSAGTVTLLGQSVPMPSGVTLPVSDVNAGDLPIQMTYADGKTETQVVKVVPGQTTKVVFAEAAKANIAATGPCLIVCKVDVINPKASRLTRDYRLGFSGGNVFSVAIPDSSGYVSFPISSANVKIVDIIGSLRGGLTGANISRRMSFSLPYSPGRVIILNYVIQRTVTEVSNHYTDGISTRKITAQERREFWDKIGARQEFAALSLAEASPGLIEATTPEISLDYGLVHVDAGGRPIQLRAKVSGDKDKASLRWSSSANEVATVSSEGLVAGLTAGTALISAKFDDGATATCVVAVWQTDDQGFSRFVCNDPLLYDWGFAHNLRSADTKLLGGPPLSVIVKKNSGLKTQGFGVRFFQQDAQNFYQLLITNEGKYLFEKKVAGKFSTIIPWSDASEINKGDAMANTLSVSQPSADSLTISINGKPEKTVHDSSFDHGTTSFFASVGNPIGEFQENFPAVPVDIRFKQTS